MGEEVGCSGGAIQSSNKGFQLLKKCGWKEGTGLGSAGQGRLEPLHAHIKNNKHGLGAEKLKKITIQRSEIPVSPEKHRSTLLQSKKKSKGCSKRIKKMLEEEERMKEKEFERAFFMEFWPDNV